MPTENVTCCACGAGCRRSESVSVVIDAAFHGLNIFEWIRSIVVYICPFCEINPDNPIPFIVTEKGRIESMRQPAKEKSNA